jgi:hypothetical protein
MHNHSTAPRLPILTCEQCGGAFKTTNFTQRGYARFCSQPCRKAYSRNPHSPGNITRFWSRVNKDGPIPPHRPDLGACWLWLGPPTNSGYGLFGLGKGTVVLAHRNAYRIQHGEIPEGLRVLHHCDVKVCTRGSHLFAGTHQENMDDMVAKGRAATGARNGRALHPESTPRGEQVATAKLTWADVRAIRAAYDGGIAKQQALADQYGVSQLHVSRIVRRVVWKE